MREPFRLTEFDREVLSVLLSHGGWSASARGKLAVLAKRYGVSATGLSRVVVGLAQAARDGRLQDATALVTRGRERSLPRREPRSPADGPSAHRMTRIDRALLATVSVLLLLALVMAVQLSVMMWRGISGRKDGTTPSAAPVDAMRVGAADPASDPSAASAAKTPAVPQANPSTTPAAQPSGPRRPPAVPVSYPKAPTFSASLDAPAFMQALAEARAAANVLDDVARDPRAVLASKQRWSDLQRAIGMSWPRIDTSLRRAHLDRMLAIFRNVDDAAMAEALLEPLQRAVTALPSGPAEIRQGAWSAGVIGALLAEPGLSPELVEVIGRSRIAPADGQGDSFERFATGWLDRALPAIIDQIGRTSAQEDFDRMEAWIEAHQRLARAQTTSEPWLLAIDGMLRRPLRLDLPGTSADLLGRLLTLVDWSSGGPDANALRRRFEAWMLDAAIEAPRLWALGSIIRQHAAAPWFTPEMVIGERATMADRRAALDRMLAAVAAAPFDAAAASRVPREMIDRRAALLERVRTLSPDGDGPARTDAQLLRSMVASAAAPARNAFAQTLEMERLAAIGAVGAMLLDGRAVEASQRLSLLESELARPSLAGLGQGGRSLTVPAAPSSDGTLGRRLDQARSAEERVDAIRRRRTETSIDLGPLDAERLVREAYFGEPSAVRSTAQGVIVDSFAAGPGVAQQLVDQFSGGGSSDAGMGRFVERLTGERLPPHTHPQFRARALGALLRHRLKLSEHPWHGVDAFLARTARVAAERLEIEGGAAEAMRDAVEPTDALEALGTLLRARASARAVLKAVPAPLEELDHRDSARRALAASRPQRLVANLWRVLELEAFIGAADRPRDADSIAAIVASAVTEASRADTALAQALDIERARIVLQSQLMGIAPVAAPVAPGDATDAATEQRAAPRSTDVRRVVEPALEQRLAALEPAHASGYLLLAEEIESRARNPEDRALARELYGLAGALDPTGFGASAALALANLAETANERARLVRLASALRPERRVAVRDSSIPQARWRFTQLISAYRRGNGSRARELLAQAEVSAFVDAFGASFEGGSAGFRNAVAALRDRPVETPTRLIELMFLEEALLSVSDGFVADLLRSNGEPLVACDPLRPGTELGVDVTRPRWRDGRWSE